MKRILLLLCSIIAGITLSCSKETEKQRDKNVELYITQVTQIMQEWNDAEALAQSTSRISLPQPVSQLQKIRRDVESLSAPSNAQDNQKLLLGYMDNVINTYLSFMSQDDVASVTSAISAREKLIEWLGSFTKLVNGAAPYVEDPAFKLAQRLDSIEAWNRFLDNYPDSTWNSTARTRLSELKEKKREESAYQQALETDSKESWEAFLKEYPYSSHASRARDRISEIELQERRAELLKQAQKRNAERLKQEQERRAERLKQEKIAFKKAEELDTVQSWEAFLRDYKDSSRVLEARQRLKELLKPRATEGLPGDYLTVDLGFDVELSLRLIPAGEFMMGAVLGDDNAHYNENPQHRVEISRPFYMGVHEVTQKQWQRVMGSDPSGFKGADHPVENVSWKEAVAFCLKVSELTGETYRLPTEAEWEYACRAGSKTKYYWGNSISEGIIKQYAWYENNALDGYWTSPHAALEGTQSVGQKLSNAWGLFDMCGNVWEWCSDWYSANYYLNSPTKDPQGPTSGAYRVIRGGCWINKAEFLRASDRNWAKPYNLNRNIGFRVLREVK